MINNVKNEKDNVLINNNETFPNDLNDLINFGKWELSLISSLKVEKNYKKNLLLIDKDWLSQWKEISGYNYIKNQIFKYLSNTQKNKNNENILEENKKINNLWINIKQKYKINTNNFQQLKQMNNKQYLINHNNRKIINGKESFEIISTDIYDVFKKYLEKNVNIKVGGLFIKKKLLMPFNYNDKNINNIFIDMMFINNTRNNKNDIEEILFVFPNLNLSIIEKIRKDISNKDINVFIKDSNDKGYEKEFYFNDEKGIKYSYKAIYKTNIDNNKNTINASNMNNPNKINNFQNTNNNNNSMGNNINNINNNSMNNNIDNNINNEINNDIKYNTTNNDITNYHKNNLHNFNYNEVSSNLSMESEETNDTKIINVNINNLTIEELENKIKEMEQKTNKLMEIENILNTNEKLYLEELNEFEKEKELFNKEKYNNEIKKNSSKSLDKLNNDINLKDEYNKYFEHLKELEFKNQYIFDEIQQCKDKEIKYNNDYKKYKNDYQEKINDLNNKIKEINNKENMIKIKDDKLINNLHKKETDIKIKEEELNLREEELNQKEKELDEKEERLDEEENKNVEKQNEINRKNYEILEKTEKIQKNEEKEKEKFNNEIDDELNELENQIKENGPKIKKKKNLSDINNKEGNDDLPTNNINNVNNRLTMNDANTFKFRKVKTMQEDSPFLSAKDIRTSKNENLSKDKNKDKNKNKINFGRISQPNFISSKTLKSPNIDNISENNEENLKIDTNKPSLGLEKQNQIINLNAIIQCFVHLKEISESLLHSDSENNFEDENKFRLTKEYLDIINNLFFPEKYNNKDGVYSISSIYEIIIKNNLEIFNNNLYCNSKDLLNILINGLHKELNTKENINNIIYSDKIIEDAIEKKALVKYLEEFTKNNNSIISKNFYGLLKNKIICQECNRERYSFKCYSYLSFNISDLKKYNKSKKIFYLKDFFDYYTKPGYLIGKAGLFCNYCHSKNTTTVLKSIYSSHPIMSIIIERGEDPNLNLDKIDFPEELDLSRYIEYKNCSKHFFLCGVVSNLEMSNNYGKFISFCRMEKNGQWFNYDNENVSKCTVEDVHNKGIQYILFYHKI